MTDPRTSDHLFTIGEIAILQNASVRTGYNGMECEVLKGPGVMRMRINATGEIVPEYGYSVMAADGEKMVARPDQLRKKRPPEQTTEWTNCHWQPKQVHA